MSISQHIASIRSRTSHQHKVSESGEQTDGPSQADELNSESLSKLSVVSLSDEDDPKPGRSITRRHTRDEGTRVAAPPPVVFSSLSNIDSIPDIEMNLDESLSQFNTLGRLESKWNELSGNLDATLVHLQDCSFQVTQSAADCLGSLRGSVDTTCDKIDTELKAFYHLMTKCDELTTKLSAATSFREEIKTLRKTVETLEQLSKSKPPPRGQPQPVVTPQQQQT